MRIEESYKRLNYGKLQATLTVIDPKVYTKPWTTTGVATLRPNTEIGEYFFAFLRSRSPLTIDPRRRPPELLRSAWLAEDESIWDCRTLRIVPRCLTVAGADRCVIHKILASRRIPRRIFDPISFADFVFVESASAKP